jgi:hypothetical protein
MAVDIGSLYTTSIPDETDEADIQAAFRLYHYGSSTYDPSNQEVLDVLPNSIAGIFKALELAINSIEPGIPPSLLGTKGSLITFDGVTLEASKLDPGTDGTVLTANSTVQQGLEWRQLPVTETSENTFENKTLDTPLITSGGFKFLASDPVGNTNITTLLAPSIPSENKTISLPDANTTLVGRDTTDTLINKVISLTTNTVTGTVAEFNTSLTNANFLTTLNLVTIEQGGTGAANANNAKINLDIFRNASGATSNKVFIQSTQPASGAVAGDLWFW